MFERRNSRLLPRPEFIRRFLRWAAIAFAVIFVALGLGVLGYHSLEGLGWIDSLLNASMILFGMGPATPIQTTAGKLFASFYAMFSGIVFLTVSALLFAPLFHRMIHRFHLDLADDEERIRDEEQGGRPKD